MTQLPQCIEQELLVVARQLEEQYHDVPNLRRLCQLGGFVIRGIDLWQDSHSYNRELQKQVNTASSATLIQSIHEYVWKFRPVNRYLTPM